MSDPAFPALFGTRGSNAAFYASGLAFGATTLILLCAVVARAKVEARVSATAARPWLRFLQLLTLAAALRCAWCFMTAADIGGSGGSKCLTGSACSVPIFITALNRLSMLIYFAAFAIFSGQIMRIGMAPRLQQRKLADGRESTFAEDSGARSTWCGGCRQALKREDGPGKRADTSINDTGVLGAGTGRSASAASKVVARTDCCLTLLAVWMLVVQLLFLAISVALELPYVSADNMYNGYICMVAILNLVLFGVIAFGLRKADDLMAGLQGYHSGEAARLRMDLALQRALASGLDGTAAAVAAADELSRGRCWCGRQKRLQAAMALAGARVARHASSSSHGGDDESDDDEDAGLFAAAARFGAGTVVAAASTVGKTGVAGVKLLGWATGLGPRGGTAPSAAINSSLLAAGAAAGRWNAAGGIAPAPLAPDAAAALAAWQQRAGALAGDPAIASDATVDRATVHDAPPQTSYAALSAVLRSQPATSLLAAAQMPADAAASRAVASKLEAQLEAIYPLLAVGDRSDRAAAYVPVPAYMPAAVAPVVLTSSRPAPSVAAAAASSMRQPLLASDSLGLAPSSGYSFDELEPHASSRPVSLSRGASASNLAGGAGKPVLAVTRAGHEEGIPLAEALAALRAVHAANGVAPADSPSSPQRSRSRGRDETRRDKRASSSSRSRSQGRRRDASAERYRLLHGMAGDGIDTSSLLNRSGEIDVDEEAAASLQLATIGPSRAGSSTALTAAADATGRGSSMGQRALPSLPAPQAIGGAFSHPPAFASPTSLRDASPAAGPSDRLPTDAEKQADALRSLSLQLRVRQHDAASRLLFGWRLELLLLCAVTGILFGLKAVMFLWRPISGTSIGGLAGVVLYPFFFYAVPECVPALLCALAAAGLPMHVVARAVFGGPLRLLRHILCCRCCCARRPSPEEARAAAAAVDILSSKTSWASGLSDPAGVLACTEPAILAAFGAAAQQPTAASAKAFLSSLAAQAGIATAAIPVLMKRDRSNVAGAALLPSQSAYDADAGAAAW